MALSTEKTWSCTTCTYGNPPSASHCAMCNAARLSRHSNTLGEWECNSCKTHNPSSLNKCTVCYARRHPIFSPNDINNINRYVNINQSNNSNNLRSNSAPNPSLIHKYNTNNNNNNNSNRYNDKKTEIFDIYTNKKKPSLLPIDIQLSHKPKLTGPTLKIHYDDDFNLSTSPSPSISSISSHNFDSISNFHLRNEINKDRNFSSSPEPINYNIPLLDLNNNNAAKITSNIKPQKLPKLGLMGKMVRKYSDPKDENTVTTLLITPKNKVDDKYSIKLLQETMNIMDSKIVEILKTRHLNDNYYKYIIDVTRDVNKTMKNNIINNTNHMNSNEEYEYPILKCMSCDNRMIHTKCPIENDTTTTNHSNGLVKCYVCNIEIYKLGMEYYHCPNVKLSEHKDIGRDICCICGVKMIMKQDKYNMDNNNNHNNVRSLKGISIDEQIILYENYLKYQTCKFEEIIPSILMITNLDDFEYIYNEIYNQTLSLNEYLDVIGILDKESIYLNNEMNKINVDISKSKSNKNDIKSECTAISNDINRVNLEITSLMKKINVLSKKKQDLQSQMQSILSVLGTMNRHEHSLEIINSKTYLYKEKIDQRIKYIKNYNQKVNILNSILNEKRKTLFGKWELWNTKQCILQLKYYLNLNNIKLNNLQLIIKEFNSKSIKGKDLINLNELTFKMMGIVDSYDQKILLLWINYVINRQQRQFRNNSFEKKTNKQTQTPPPVNININNNNQIDIENDSNINECKMELSSPNSPSIASINTNRTKHENKNKNNLLCAVCMVNNVNVILNPCGHICICDTCSIKIKQICPVCRIEITEIKHCFFANR